MDEQKQSALAKLVWLDPYTGKTQEHPICDGDRLTIGRSASNSIQIAEGHISREHAIVACQGGAFTIDDVGSANGTFVNGVQVYGANALVVGDEIHLFCLRAQIAFSHRQAAARQRRESIRRGR